MNTSTIALNRYKTERAEKKRIKYLKELKKTKGFLPFLNIRNARKFSRRSLLAPFKSSHNHHLLSDGETALFHINESDRRVIAIYEQFPLLEFEETIAIAEQEGIRHPRDRDGEIVIMTIDHMLLCVDLETKEEFFEAHTYKMSQDMDKEKVGPRKLKRTLEKFKIERLYLAARGIKHLVKTERDVPRVKTHNLAWAREGLYYKANYEPYLDQIHKGLLILHFRDAKASTKELLDTLAVTLSLDYTTVLFAYQYLICSGRLNIDHSKKISLMAPFKLADSLEEK